MADPAITLPKIVSLAMPVVDTTPTIAMTRIADLPDAQTMAPLSTAMPAQAMSQDWSHVPSAAVTITDRAPVIQQVNTGIVPPSRFQPLPVRTPPPSGTPWWKDPMKLGLAAAAALLVVLVLTKKE